jgi:hypothetical protein
MKKIKRNYIRKVTFIKYLKSMNKIIQVTYSAYMTKKTTF